MKPVQRETMVDLRFPLKGINTSTSYHKQPEETTPSAINVWAFDSGTDRARGGSRAGLGQFIGTNQQVDGTHLIQSLSCIVTADSNAIG
jgi:hypothetical protein